MNLRRPNEWGDVHARVPEHMWADVDAFDVVKWVSKHSPGTNVLDCGVGTGRVAEPVQAAGYRVLGLDSSAAMLKLARARGIVCKRVDLGQRWGAVGLWDCLLWCSNFVGLLETRRRQLRALQEARRHAFRRWSVLAVQTHYPTDAALDRWRAGGGDVNEHAQLVQSRATWPDGEHVQQWRYLDPGDLVFVAAKAGWKPVSLAADFRGSPLVESSPQYVQTFIAA